MGLNIPMKLCMVNARVKAAIFISLLSPLFGEVLSGSTPPSEVIANLLAFPLLWAYYGSGLLLFRELWVRKNGGSLSLMLFGAAYGVIEEGLFIKSWFDPNWPDLGVLGHYGRVAGVNVVWAVWLTIFHTYMSIWVPVILGVLIFPALGKESLLSGRSIYLLLAIFIGMGILMFSLLNPYLPPVPQYILAVLIAISFIYLGTKVREVRRKSSWAKRYPFLFGFSFLFSMFILFVMVPYTSIPFFIPVLLGIPIYLLFFWVQNAMNWRERHLLLLGSLSFWLLFMDFVFSTMGYPLELPAGWLTFFFIVFLFHRRYGFKFLVMNR